MTQRDRRKLAEIAFHTGELEDEIGAPLLHIELQGHALDLQGYSNWRAPRFGGAGKSAGGRADHASLVMPVETEEELGDEDLKPEGGETLEEVSGGGSGAPFGVGGGEGEASWGRGMGRGGRGMGRLLAESPQQAPPSGAILSGRERRMLMVGCEA